MAAWLSKEILDRCFLQETIYKLLSLTWCWCARVCCLSVHALGTRMQVTCPGEEKKRSFHHDVCQGSSVTRYSHMYKVNNRECTVVGSSNRLQKEEEVEACALRGQREAVQRNPHLRACVPYIRAQNDYANM